MPQHAFLLGKAFHGVNTLQNVDQGRKHETNQKGQCSSGFGGGGMYCLASIIEEMIFALRFLGRFFQWPIFNSSVFK